MYGQKLRNKYIFEYFDRINPDGEDNLHDLEISKFKFRFNTIISSDPAANFFDENCQRSLKRIFRYQIHVQKILPRILYYITTNYII